LYDINIYIRLVYVFVRYIG